MIHADIRTLRASDLPMVDVVVGSPPCQDLSTANPRATGIDGSRSGLFFEAIRLVGECRPYWGALENVPPSRVRGIDRACAALEALDYACWPIVVGADCAGAPHIRERLWLVFADPARATRQQVARVASGHALGAGLALGQVEPARQERAPAQRAVGIDAMQPEDACPHGIGPHDWCFECERAFAHGTFADASSIRREDTGKVGGGSETPQGKGRVLKPGRETSGYRHPWQAGLPDFAFLDDGSAAELARNGALYRAICAAQGDAIVPQIAYHIIRTMSAMFPDARRVLDLFAGGVGGWTYACKWVGLDVVAACEIDPWRRQVYAAAHQSEVS